MFAILYKEDNFCHFLLAFLPFRKPVCFKGKDFAPMREGRGVSMCLCVCVCVCVCVCGGGGVGGGGGLNNFL